MTDNERLSRELRDRAAHTGGHPISFDDVKRSATKMKWQQRAATGVVAAVALAIAIPVGLSVARGDGTADGNLPVATNTPTPTTTQTPTQNPDPDGDGRVTLTLDAPGGPTPRISWIEGKTLHLADGTSEELPKAYSSVVSYQGGFMAFDYAMNRIDVIRDGDVVDSFAGMGFAVSTDGTEVAWYEGGVDGGALKRGLVSGTGEGEESVDVPAGYLVTPLLLTPSTRLIYSLESQSEPYEKTIWFTDFVGDAKQIEGAESVGGYNPETAQVAVQTSSDDFGSCWALYSYGGGEAPETFGKETCDYSLGAFSADGQFVIGWDAYRDGWGNGDIAILDAQTLKPVMVFEPERDYGVQAAVWDGEDNSLIASVYLDTWQLVRLGVDGSIETASSAFAGDDMSNPFRFVDVR